MLDDKKLKTQMLNELSDDNIPELAFDIKQKYLVKHQEKIKPTPWFKKPLTWFVGVPLLACSIAIAIIVPNIVIQGTGLHHGTKIALMGKDNELAFGVLSVDNLMDDGLSNGGGLLQRAVQIPHSELDKEIEQLHPYMLTAEEMLDNSFDINPTVENGNFDINGQTYTNKMSINNGSETLTFYYSEDGTINNLNPYYSDDDDEDEEELESEYSVNGVFARGDQFHKVIGVKELEADEFELTLKIFTNELNGDYILIENGQENEDGVREESYVYSKFIADEEVWVSEISFEQEKDGKAAVDIEFEVGDNESEYKIYKTDIGFKAEYDFSKYDDGALDITIVEANEGTNYKYEEKSLGYSKEIKRN